MKKNNESSIVININGDNNTIIINGEKDNVSPNKNTNKKKKSFKTWLKALVKLVCPVLANIIVILLETIFAKLFG